MSEYIMDPGARLYIGPHGRPMESMGRGLGTAVEYATAKRSGRRAAALGASCCASCAIGTRPCALKGLGATLFESIEAQAAANAVPKPAPLVAAASSLPVYLAIAGVAGVGLFFFMRRRKRH